MLKPRAHDRSSVALAGFLISDDDPDTEIGCEIADLSPGGAKIKAPIQFEVGAAMQLMIGALGPYPVKVVWQRPSEAGLSFQQPPEVMAEVIMAVATYG